ncbi:MAG: isoaspartyl peptidase/L-asparaginase [Gemmatimonadota bacterium]
MQSSVPGRSVVALRRFPGSARNRGPGRLLGVLVLAVTFGLGGCELEQPEMPDAPGDDAPGAEYGIVIHGGAGTIVRENMTAEREAAYHASLEGALVAGYGVLEEGGSAVDAVIAAVRVMEDDSLFNAGKGAVFTNEGTNELDAAVMSGRDREAGAVAGVRNIRNPIELARIVMDESPHVLLTGEGAETYARQFGVEEVDPSYFYTEGRWEALERAREADAAGRAERPGENRMIGTVGAVARDRNGDLAAATSTGGMTNKRFGRVGDVPLIGAGTYASNESCAISATGHGEYFIRNVVARDICARMEHIGESLEEAAHALVMEKLVDHGGTGGVVGIDREGHITMTLNTPGMYRGYYLAGAEPFTAIYEDEGSGR